MHRVKLDTAAPAVKEFLRTLPSDPEGVELELEGTVLYKLIAPQQLTEPEKRAIIDRGRELVRQARERNKGVPAKVIEREVRQAVDEVRRRQRS